MKRLEVTIQELEDQCVSFTEKIRVITDEKNRFGEHLVLSYFVSFLSACRYSSIQKVKEVGEQA